MIEHVMTLHRSGNGWIVVRPSNREDGQFEVLTFEGDDADTLSRALYSGLMFEVRTKRSGGITITAHEHGWENEEEQ